MHIKLVTLALHAVLVATCSAFFRLPCSAPVVVQRADPIVNPGQVAGHLHTVMGGNGFGFEMNYIATQASTCSTCSVKQDKSNYWVPTLFYKAKNGSFISVEQREGMLVYYLQRQDPNDPEFAKGIHAFPPGFTILAGDPNLRSFINTPEQNAISYACLGTNTEEAKGFPNIKCPGGLRAQVFLPSCWDGVLFSPKDQKKHLAYPSGVDSGHCSPPFNKRLISLFYEVIWNTPAFDALWYGNSQPFLWSNGDPTGYGYHGDFVNGWDVPVLQKAIDSCTSASGVIEECKVFGFYTSQEMAACSIPVSIKESTHGILDALPGCNPIQTGPSSAVPKSGCGAPTTISPPELPFTDITQSKIFKYVGCALDIAGQPRTLGGADMTDELGLTIELCVDYCQTQGFSIAGMEYSKQCFCGNSFPSNRLPSPSAVGNCNMPCTGNPFQKCGGASLISLYQKCNGKCQNQMPIFINGSAGTSLISKKKIAVSKPVSIMLLTPGKHTEVSEAVVARKPPARKGKGTKKDTNVFKEDNSNHR